MNDHPNSKTALIKTLAIVGFFATLAILVWLFIQGFRFVPSAFTSLASIADSINSYRPDAELNVAVEKTIVNSGESFKLTWTDLGEPGTYRFNYACVPGVSLMVKGGDGALVPMTCTDTLSFEDDVLGLFVSINSAEQRFSDVALTVSFEHEKGDIRAEKEVQVTVVNATVPVHDTAATTTPTTPVVTEPVKPATPVVATPDPKPVVPTTPAEPITEVKTVTYIPVSNPNGFTDLKITYLGIGTMDGSTFTPAATFDNDKRGGVKIEVKNIGTKTSGEWTFTTDLPSGISYESSTQAGLKPNERVEFVLGFDFDEKQKAETQKITSTLKVSGDTKKENNSITWSAKITD